MTKTVEELEQEVQEAYAFWLELGRFEGKIADLETHDAFERWITLRRELHQARNFVPPQRCELCGEQLLEHQERGEFAVVGGDSILAHADCGLGRGLEIA